MQLLIDTDEKVAVEKAAEVALVTSEGAATDGAEEPVTGEGAEVDGGSGGQAKERKRVKEAERKRERVRRLQPRLLAAQAQQEAQQLQDDVNALRLRRSALDQQIDANQLLVKADEKAAGWTEVSSRTNSAPKR